MTDAEIAEARERVERRNQVRQEAVERASEIGSSDRQIIERQFAEARNEAYHIRHRGRTLYS